VRTKKLDIYGKKKIECSCLYNAMLVVGCCCCMLTFRLSPVGGRSIKVASRK
jgi:hypothetical protein